MGRPVNKKWFGRLADATDARFKTAGDTFYNITLNVQVGSNAETASGYILKQRSSRRFLVNDLKTGTNTSVPEAVADAAANGGSTTQGNVGFCLLVDKPAGALGADEMSIQGVISGTGGNQVRVKKLFNRTCVDFDNNRYTWEIQDDSTVTQMVLTSI